MKAITIKIVRNVALQVVADNNGEKCHVVALVNQEKTKENSNLEIKGDIPCHTESMPERSVKPQAVRGLILHCALTICKWAGCKSVVKS